MKTKGREERVKGKGVGVRVSLCIPANCSGGKVTEEGLCTKVKIRGAKGREVFLSAVTGLGFQLHL